MYGKVPQALWFCECMGTELGLSIVPLYGRRVGGVSWSPEVQSLENESRSISLVCIVGLCVSLRSLIHQFSSAFDSSKRVHCVTVTSDWGSLLITHRSSPHSAVKQMKVDHLKIESYNKLHHATPISHQALVHALRHRSTLEPGNPSTVQCSFVVATCCNRPSSRVRLLSSAVLGLVILEHALSSCFSTAHLLPFSLKMSPDLPNAPACHPRIPLPYRSRSLVLTCAPQQALYSS